MTTAQLSPTSALVVVGESERGETWSLLEDLGYQPVVVNNSDALATMRGPIALCLIDLRENGDALRVIRAVRIRQPDAVVIGIADPERPTAAADAIRAGAFDVLPRPPVARDLEALVANAREHAALGASADAAHTPDLMSYGIVGSSPAMRLVMDLVQRAAAGRCGILVSGERGTGREMIARAIHAHGVSRTAPFVKVDCSSDEDAELQLFGTTKRSAAQSPERRTLEVLGSRSLLLEAAGGILFLEHLLQLPARVQSRLVRVFRDREVFVEDQPDPRPLDVRPIASVDASFEMAIEEGRLRQDLHERLSLIRIEVPPLRQRREDIPVLATYFLKELCRANALPLKTLTRPALTVLSALPWRGNAPELRGLLERLLLLVPHGLIRLEDVLAHTQLEGGISPNGVDATLRQARTRFEREYIAAVLQHHHGRIAEAARVLGVQRTNLYRKMRRLNLMRWKATSGREL